MAKSFEQREYAVQIKEALDFIKASTSAVKENTKKEQKDADKFAESKLKAKGNLSFSDML